MSADSLTSAPGNAPVRGTQLLVEHMSDVFGRPSLVAIEIAWRWLFGIPFLLVCWRWVVSLLSKQELLDGNFSIDTRDPWHAAKQLADAWDVCKPLFKDLHTLLPIAAIAWIVISGFGRAVLLRRMESNRSPRLPFRPITTMALQAAWLLFAALILWGWFSSMRWIGATHISALAEPDLIGYFIWAIFISLGFFTAFSLLSWPFSIAPLLALLEGDSVLDALSQSFMLGKAFAGKLIEINLVMGIVKLALLVVAMVFSAAPLPFSDELGPGAMHLVAAVSGLFFLVANDFFQVVRLKAFVEFWRIFRGASAA